jgi:hypothetical protein
MAPETGGEWLRRTEPGPEPIKHSVCLPPMIWQAGRGNTPAGMVGDVWRCECGKLYKIKYQYQYGHCQKIWRRRYWPLRQKAKSAKISE